VVGPGRPDRTQQPSERSAPDAVGWAHPATRGFLFADLRDYTAFVHAHGDHAAADLIGRYRTLVRAAVADHAGAEIRTEGDSFYVVFDSASAAVRCGMAIVAAASALADGPCGAIQVGVGVHAGDAVATTEGYVGSAVNIAARLCDQAKAGELVVSDTVRALTRTYLDVRFEPLGTRRLKGLDEPIALYRVVPRVSVDVVRPSAGWPGMPRAWWLAGLGALLVVVVVGGAAAAVWQGARPSPSDAPSAATARQPGASAEPAPTTAGDAPVASAAPTTDASPGTSGATGISGSTEAEQALLARIPREFQPFCRRSSLPDGSLGGDAASLRCDLPFGTAAVFGADTVWYDAFSAPGLMATAVNGVATRQDLPLVDGAATAMAETCTSGSGSGIGRWTLGITFTGQLACYAKDGGAWVLWTYEGQQIAARAVRHDGDAVHLYDWWQQQASGFLR
jgi:class 3 adenylate cyclase